MNRSSRLYRNSVFICMLFALGSCKDYKPEMEQAMMERDSVMMLSIAKDSSINAFLQTLNEIELNLDSITQKQQAINLETRNNTEFNKDIRERINQNIAFISELLDKNQSMLNNLNEKLRKSNIQIGSLKTMIDKLNADIATKTAEIAMMYAEIENLRANLDMANQKVDSLTVVNTRKEEIITDKTNQLQTAYWIIGSYKELKSKNILSKKGGFLGIGREKTVKTDFNNEIFNQIDITKVTRFDVNNKSADIITSHPTDSYKIEKDTKGVITHIEVTDPARFWKASKYLVIVTG